LVSTLWSGNLRGLCLAAVDARKCQQMAKLKCPGGRRRRLRSGGSEDPLNGLDGRLAAALMRLVQVNYGPRPAYHTSNPVIRNDSKINLAAVAEIVLETQSDLISMGVRVHGAGKEKITE